MHGTNNIKLANNMSDYTIITCGTQHTRQKMFQIYTQAKTSRTKRHIKSRNNLLPGQIIGDRGGTVVKVLCYKSEGRWFDSRWCHWNFSMT